MAGDNAKPSLMQMSRRAFADVMGMVFKNLLFVTMVCIAVQSLAQDKGKNRQAEPRIQVRWVADKPDSNQAAGFPWNDPNEKEPELWLNGEVLFTEDDFTSATVGTDPLPNSRTVLLRFSPDARERFATLAGENIGRRLAIVLDGKVLNAPVIRDRITGNRLALTSNMTEEQANSIIQIYAKDKPASSGAAPTSDSRVLEGQFKLKESDSALQQRIDAAAANEVIQLGEGTIKGPITITKPLTLRGAGMDKTFIEVMGEFPAISIKKTENVRLEKLTVRWSPASTDVRLKDPAAVAVRDATATLEQVALEPIDRPESTPNGLLAAGRSDVTFTGGRSKGFAYALMFIEGANGRVLDSVLEGAGHSVVTMHPYSRVEIARNFLARCGYHAVRNTGGVMDMHDNIVIDCAKAGAYLGNKDAHGRIYNNLFSGNNGEIWGYSGSDVAIENNLFYRSKDAAIIFWNTCNLNVENNSFVKCPGALRQYVRDERPEKIGVTDKANHYWQNGEDLQPGKIPGAESKKDSRFTLNKSPESFSGDPKFRDPAQGDFTPMEGSALLSGGKIIAGPAQPKTLYDLVRAAGLKFAGMEP